MRYRNVAGLSYVEVMVSMLTSALFLSTTLQAYIAATSLRVKTRDANAAIASVQADVEGIRQMAQALPSDAADCKLPPSGSYARQVMQSVIDKDAAALNTLIEKPPEAVVGSIVPSKDQSSVLQQSATLPIAGLPEDYQMHRILSVDTSGLPSEQVLQISYRVVRQPTQGQQGDSATSQIDLVSSETPVAQLHTAILPNAALVCF
jgi:hypothetical protein